MAISQTGSNTATGTSATPSITHGLTINEGDLVQIVGHANALGNTWSDNNGSTPLTIDFQENGAETNTYAIMTRLAGASEPSAYSFGLLSSQNWSIQTRVFSGVHADIWDVAPATGTRATGLGTTATAPSMTTGTDGAMGLIIEVTDNSTTSLSDPTNGYGTLISISSSITQGSAIRTWDTAGETGTTNLTLSVSQDWLIHQVALKAAVDATVNDRATRLLLLGVG